MPKRRRVIRKRRELNKLVDHARENAIENTTRKLRENQAWRNFSIDTGTGTTAAEKKMKARNKVLGVERIIQVPGSDQEKPSQKRKRNDELKKVEAIRREIKRPKLAVPKQTNDKEMVDLWDTNGDESKHETSRWEALPAGPVIKKRRKIVKPSTLEAVSVPDPGLSYNPDVTQYQNLLNKAIAEQLQKRKELEKFSRNLSYYGKRDHINELKKYHPDDIDLYKNMTKNEREKEDEKEEEEGEEEREEEEEGEEIEEEEEKKGEEKNDPGSKDVKVNRDHIPRVTKVQRNKLKRKKAAALELRKQRRAQILMSQINNLKSHVKKVEKIQEKVRQRAENKQEEKEKDGLRTKKLGPMKYVKPDIEVILPDQVVLLC
eukprot:TRINITY_DN2356_c0_g1_i1.p1 TRINITY_DN2356_c0_g1~~TRINITY_DN2356_c0_g1_i1.p1  ORF type:complete len:375 (+),score=111.36 TRINITY_DN2356_c0_g1_i1:52-1176(+)